MYFQTIQHWFLLVGYNFPIRIMYFDFPVIIFLRTTLVSVFKRKLFGFNKEAFKVNVVICVL